MVILLTLFLGNIGQENGFYDILERKKRLCRLLKQQVQKVKKIDIYPKVSMVLVQKWPFSQLLCLGNIGQETVFYDILE